ncbi:LCP family protein [Actinomycetaceae bacterium TAE3-ERU4]|nr:LCP family protein [Actinomycetaceae bacterium TAE3-ERU4]
MPLLHSTKKGRPRWRRGILLTLLAIFLAISTSAAFLAHAVLGGIKVIKIKDQTGGSVNSAPVDTSAGRSLTFLLLGTDSREGQQNLAIGGGDDQTVRADTTIVVKIAPDRKSAIMASMPRDALVNIPECTLSNGKTIAARRHSMFNSAFSYAAANSEEGVQDGVACAVKTFKSVTGIPLDGVVVADFAGFSKVVDAIGGVNVCLREPFKPHAVGDFALPAGKSHLNGMEAIQFVRARKGVGDGSDTQRQIRQHYFLKNAWKRVEAEGVLSDPIKALNLLQSVKSILRFSESISDPGTLVGLGYSMRHMKPSDIVSLRVPFEYAGPRVVLTEDAQEVWDKFLPTTLADMKSQTPSPEPGKPSESKPTENPATPKQEDSKKSAPASPQSTPSAEEPAIKHDDNPKINGSEEKSEEDTQGLLVCPQN